MQASMHVQVYAFDCSRVYAYNSSVCMWKLICTTCASWCAWKLYGSVHKSVGIHKFIQMCVSLCVQIQVHKSVCRSDACKPCASCACASLIHMFASPCEYICKPECMLKSMCVCVCMYKLCHMCENLVYMYICKPVCISASLCVCKSCVWEAIYACKPIYMCA